MELQLGLALPITHNPMKGFDLNCHGLEPKDDQSVIRGCLESKTQLKNKRSFSEAFGENDASAKTLPLFLWNGQPNEEDDGEGPKKTTSSITSNITNDEENRVVGWPPIKSLMKKLLHHNQGGRMAIDRTAERGRLGGSNSMYVKVKMEGVAIGRKVDLRLYHSYQMLTNSLITMFARYEKRYKEDVRYTLTYQDKEGDWLLAGDVPWQTFTKSVQRLEILRNAG